MAEAEPREFQVCYGVFRVSIDLADVTFYTTRMASKIIGADQTIAALEKKLKQAHKLQRQINKLQAQLDSLVGADHQTGRRGTRRMSAAARAKIAAAQRARWAKVKGSTAKRRRKKSGLTPAGRRKLSQMMKARWAAKKKAKP